MQNTEISATRHVAKIKTLGTSNKKAVKSKPFLKALWPTTKLHINKMFKVIIFLTHNYYTTSFVCGLKKKQFKKASGTIEF